MKQLLTLLLILLSSVPSFSQSASGRYFSRKTQDGDLYFITPHRLKNLSGLKRFEYDVTMLNWTDSVTVNFTYESESMVVPEQLEVVCDSGAIKCDTYAPIYVDIKKNHYEVRITSKFSLPDFIKMIESGSPPCFNFRQNGQPKMATYSPKSWTKDQKKLKDILEIYLYTR